MPLFAESVLCDVLLVMGALMLALWVVSGASKNE